MILAVVVFILTHFDELVNLIKLPLEELSGG